jgi:hypothetical protein
MAIFLVENEMENLEIPVLIVDVINQILDNVLNTNVDLRYTLKQ